MIVPRLAELPVPPVGEIAVETVAWLMVWLILITGTSAMKSHRTLDRRWNNVSRPRRLVSISVFSSKF